ncbi:Hypothetical protein, putative [Bodo saltans]|uniref:Uncharacterized protein n=1 Tax=Bodo saltans TaxID=75058 RepID=A0A0S4JQW4_BODSA|nr:Hypothetical protein, putative [Bodo saltans]|eukprot:CUG93906.1 Hypothetical protein, putative [Bodo saltans]
MSTQCEACLPMSLKKKPAAAASAAKKGAEPPAVSSALHSGMTPEDRFQQSKEDAVKFAVKAAVLFNRCYRVQYTYVALQNYVNAMRSLFANEPPSMLSDVLQQARIAEQGGGVSSRSAGSTVPGQQAYHLTLHTANTKPIMDSISKVETPSKVMANEIIKLLKQFQDGFANAAKEVECLQPVSVKTGEDCLPERGGIIRRTTSLQMWLSEEGQFEEHRRDVQDLERKAIRERIYERERNEMQEVENWERLVIFKNWVKEFLDMSKGEGASDDNALVESLYLQFRALTGTAPSSRHSETTEGSQRVGTGVSRGGDARGGRSTSPIPPALIKSNRKAAAKKKILLLQNSKLNPTQPAAALADESDGAQTADVGYQTIDFQSKLGKNISLDEIIRCFSYVVRCLQYGQRKQSAVAMTMEVNEITKNHYATLLLPYALNLQSAMGQNTEKIMLKYATGHREIVRTKKLIQEAHRMLSVYKESDAYRRAQLKLANTLQPSRRGIVVPQDAEFFF